MAKGKTQKKAAKKKAASVNGKKTTKKASNGKVKSAPKTPDRPSYDRPHRLVEHDILAGGNGPMNAMELATLMVDQGQISGRTPQATVGRDLCMNPDLFAKIARGRYVAISKELNGKKFEEARVILGHKDVGAVKAYIKAYKDNGGKAPIPALAPRKNGTKAPKTPPKANGKKAAEKLRKGK